MIIYNNININVLTPQDISDLIIRNYNNDRIIGLVTNSSSFLHKRKRFRPGGIFCEEIFGKVYLCTKNKCNSRQQFNSNPISNKLCCTCRCFMILNFKRKYRFGSIFFNFPVLNYHYFKYFIDLLKIFKRVEKQYFYKNKSFRIDKCNFVKNIVIDSIILENKFLNFIILFYETTKSVEIFKVKLHLLNKNKPIQNDKFNRLYKFLNNFLFLKKVIMILFPVLPPNLRIYSLDNKKFSFNSKLNKLYNTIIDLNNGIIEKNFDQCNLKNILNLHILIEIIVDCSKSKNVFKQNVYMYNKLYGKYGVFRQNLLGFRVDYSGRTTIVPGPSLSLNTIGLPINMLNYYINSDINVTNDGAFYESYIYEKLSYLNEFLSIYSVIVNRAPTLHKMNMQSFNPVITEGESIKFMPLLCSGYNADFDGDQMGIFSALKFNSLFESLYMLKSFVNLYSPTTKTSVFNLTQGMAAGQYILNNYNYLKYINMYISCNYVDLLEYIQRNFIDAPILLRNVNLFYLTTCGRLLSNFNI